MSEELLEAEAVEEPVAQGEVETPTRPLPARQERTEELEAWKGEVRTAAIAAAGGLVAGVATVAAVNAARAVGSRKPRSRLLRRGSKRERAVDVVASRSFLIDVHVLGR
ncbi:MAG: hypothetical protein ACRDL1_03505 [Solirubrobacterales bacterium]